MLPKENRLTKKKEIDAVFKDGKTGFASFLLLKFINNNLNYPRFAIIASNKVSKKAVVRNLLRRRIREILRKRLEKFLNIDGIIVLNPKTKDAEFKDLEKELDYIFKNAKILK